MEEEQIRWDKAVNSCYECGKEASSDLKLKRCTRCKYTLYCSLTCQKKGWSQGHKDECLEIAKEKSQGTWSLATGTVAMLPNGHRLWNEPTPEAGLEIAKEVSSQKLSAREVYSRNALLGLWMSRLIMLDHDQLQLFADFMMGSCRIRLMPQHLLKSPERMALLRGIFLVGCGSCGQPTLAEIVKVKFRRHKLQKWKEMNECTFFEIDKETGGTATFMCRRSKNVASLTSSHTSTCAMGVIARDLQEFTNPTFMATVGNFDNVHLFCDKKFPNVALDADAVERDLCQVLEALGISTYPSIDAIMSATSMRVLRDDQGIPQKYHLLRKYIGVRCLWPDF